MYKFTLHGRTRLFTKNLTSSNTSIHVEIREHCKPSLSVDKITINYSYYLLITTVLHGKCDTYSHLLIPGPVPDDNTSGKRLAIRRSPRSEIPFRTEVMHFQVKNKGQYKF